MLENSSSNSPRCRSSSSRSLAASSFLIRLSWMISSMVSGKSSSSFSMLDFRSSESSRDDNGRPLCWRSSSWNESDQGRRESESLVLVGMYPQWTCCVLGVETSTRNRWSKLGLCAWIHHMVTLFLQANLQRSKINKKHANHGVILIHDMFTGRSVKTTCTLKTWCPKNTNSLTSEHDVFSRKRPSFPKLKLFFACRWRKRTKRCTPPPGAPESSGRSPPKRASRKEELRWEVNLSSSRKEVNFRIDFSETRKYTIHNQCVNVSTLNEWTSDGSNLLTQRSNEDLWRWG